MEVTLEELNKLINDARIEIFKALSQKCVNIDTHGVCQCKHHIINHHHHQKVAVCEIENCPLLEEKKRG